MEVRRGRQQDGSSSGRLGWERRWGCTASDAWPDVTWEGREPFKDAAMRGWSEGERGGRQQDERGTEDKESQG